MKEEEQNEHIKKQTCPSIALSFVLTHSSDKLYQYTNDYTIYTIIGIVCLTST